MKTLKVFFSLFFFMLVFSCKKNPAGTDSPFPAGKFSYGDSVFYLKQDAYVVSPNIAMAGTYQAFPDDLNIDPATGKITVSVRGRENKQSQTGLRYKVTFTAATGEKDSTFVVIAGVTYQDRIYHLPQNDSLVNPIYNATPSLGLPAGTFTCSNNKLAINPANGQINLKKTLANGFFSDDPQNNDWRIVTIKYSTNDKSTSDKNNLDVVVYYYTAEANIPSNVSAAMRAHQGLLLGISPVTIPVTHAPVDNDIKNIVSAFKPRPPCVIIVGN